MEIAKIIGLVDDLSDALDAASAGLAAAEASVADSGLPQKVKDGVKTAASAVKTADGIADAVRQAVDPA